ncbi:MAG: DinB family protein [Balneolaceae bacterium]|nr:DinB family protein [Balneolaceae bacterium]
MTPADRLEKLFNYDRWANRKVLDALEIHSSFAERGRAIDYLNHIIGTHHHWYYRVTGTELPDTEIWPEFLLADCRALIDANHRRWTALISEGKDELDRPVTYSNSRGEEHTSLLSDILHHLVIHGQHHRAQIAKLLRASNIDPPATDFIFYTRKMD